MFFISPPPSPPHGWQMRDEGPPNREVHAEDLEQALAGLHKKSERQKNADEAEERRWEKEVSDASEAALRPRSGSSTVVYDPVNHGDSADLPAVMVEDTTETPEAVDLDADEEDGAESTKKPLTHTARPPVELME